MERAFRAAPRRRAVDASADGVLLCVLRMKTVTFKIPDRLDAKVRRTLSRRKESFSELARRAIEREVEEQEVDFAKMAAPYRGMFRGAKDLSSREGYGDKNNR